MKKIGLFGGTFDPIHLGHLIIAQSVCETLSLDTVVFIPSARPPHKDADIMFSPETRYTMIEHAIMGNDSFRVSDIEMKRSGPSFTIDTIRELKSTADHDSEFLFIVGKDNLFEIDKWKEPESIIDECRIIVADRPGSFDRAIPEWLSGKVETVQAPLIDISSSDIRRRIREGSCIRYLVPEPVERFIFGRIS
ncbi:nicotinate-nucleotide adenylyltransferase [Candidatus Latescibacterota bacterium]